MGQTIIQVRVDDGLKQEATEVLEQLGLDMPNAIRMFLKRIVIERGLPFEAKLPTEEKCYQVQENSSMELECIPAANFKYVDVDEYYDALKLVPAGKLTRWDDIMDYLRAKHNASRIEINYSAKQMSPVDCGVPLWREVSTRGFVQADRFFMSQAEKARRLEAEGFTMVSGGINGESLKVEHYKEYLFDFSKMKS